MANVLIVHHNRLGHRVLPTYRHHLYSLRQYSSHECIYFNAARPRVPGYVRRLRPDLVVFHHTFLTMRQVAPHWEHLQDLVAFLKDAQCEKVLIAQDEQVRMDLSVRFVNEFGISRIFTPAPPHLWHRMYAGVDLKTVSFHPILNGYVDDVVVRRTAARARRLDDRPIDIGYRTWYAQPFYGSHGQLKQALGRAFKERAPEFGLTTDISCSIEDALWGGSWFDFLLRCKYTVGVEGGCSVFDWDGSVAARTTEYVDAHPDADFQEVEAACFAGLDGDFADYSMSPRHLEAVITKTGQILIEGEYSGVLEPWVHYFELKRDFSNLDDVLVLMQRDDRRAELVGRAYDDIVASGKYSYRAFADLVFSQSLGTRSRSKHVILRPLLNRLDEASWRLLGFARLAMLSASRKAGILLLGEARFRRTVGALRGGSKG